MREALQRFSTRSPPKWQVIQVFLFHSYSVLTGKKKECGENECEQQASPVGTLGLTWNIVYSEECEIFPQGEMEVTQILARLNDNNGCSKGSASRLMFDFRPFVSSLALIINLLNAFV